METRSEPLIKLHSLQRYVIWKHLQPVFKEFPAYTNGVSDLLFDKGLCLPSSSNLTDNQKHRIKESLIYILENS